VGKSVSFCTSIVWIRTFCFNNISGFILSEKGKHKDVGSDWINVHDVDNDSFVDRFRSMPFSRFICTISNILASKESQEKTKKKIQIQMVFQKKVVAIILEKSIETKNCYSYGWQT
jgi:hypothetical protein